MKWDKTVASKCRYGEVAEEIWGTWDIIWEDSESDYQGHASFLAEKDGKYCFYEWWYGSCSGCDGWEADGKSDDEIEQEMRDTALWLDDIDQLKVWFVNLTGFPISNYNMERGGALVQGLDLLGGGLRKRIEAIRKYLEEKESQ